MTFRIILCHIELSEEIERNHSVDIHNDCEQHYCQHELKMKYKHIGKHKNIHNPTKLKHFFMYLFSIVSYGLQNGFQGRNSNSNIQQMSRKEEKVEVAQDRETEIPQTVQKCIVCHSDSSFPQLIAPVNSSNTEKNLTYH